MAVWLRRTITVAGGLLIASYIFFRVDFHSMWHVMKGVHPGALIAMLALACAQFVLSSVIWQMLLRKQGIESKLTPLVADYYIAAFLSTVLPTKYSGDVYRMYQTGKRSGRASDCAAAVMLERLAGIVLIMLMGIAAGFLSDEIFANSTLEQKLGVALAVVLAGVLVVFTDGAYRLLGSLLHVVRLDRFGHPLEKFRAAVSRYRSDSWFLGKILLVSGVFKVLAFVCIYLAAVSLGQKIDPAAVILIMPVIYVLEALPVSIHGLGVREGAFVFFFSKAGLLAHEALALSLVVLLGRTFVALVGGIIFLGREYGKKSFGYGRRGIRGVVPVASINQ